MEQLHSISSCEAQLRSGAYDSRLSRWYGCKGNAILPYRERILSALQGFRAQYGERDICIFSVSGRTELGGNHTDHQHGCVLAGGISLDIIAIAAPTEDGKLCVKSEGYPEDVMAAVDLDIHPSESEQSIALLRGTAARFRELGYPVGGFVAYTTSNVLKGSGLSSSAAFEVMLGKICNTFYANGAFSPAELAMIAQYAENQYFGKPCGLMDQMACALGGVVAIDFAEPRKPSYRQVTLDLAKEGYALCIIDSGADHADLTDAYAAIPREMRSVAAALGKEVLRQVDEAAFWTAVPKLRRACGDRAVLRAMHFFADNARVGEQVAALEAHRFDVYLRLVKASGESSVANLQNIRADGSEQQAVAIALGLCAHLLDGKGAYRVHGGGFAGTIQAYVPLGICDAFCEAMNAGMGAECCHVLQIRSEGAAMLWETE